ncbi:MAG: hypothetical protein ACM31P_03245 [Actinomycetota bacterium]
MENGIAMPAWLHQGGTIERISALERSAGSVQAWWLRFGPPLPGQHLVHRGEKASAAAADADITFF